MDFFNFKYKIFTKNILKFIKPLNFDHYYIFPLTFLFQFKIFINNYLKINNFKFKKL